MGYRIVLAPQADDDLAAIVAFIAQDSQQAAIRIGDELVDAAFSLNEMPFRGAPVRNRSDTRKLIHLHYLIIYRVNDRERVVEILRFWDGRKDPKKLSLG